jgi:hypothetical protein
MAKPKRQHLDALSFAGQEAKVVDLPATSRDLILLKHGPDQALAVAWDLDNHGCGFWRIQQIGLVDSALVTKELRRGEVGAAFYGEVSVVGAGNNDLYTSDGFEDADVVDHEGNVINKIREIRIYPKRTT